MTRTIVLVVDDDGKINVIEGGEVGPAVGLAVCQAARDWYQRVLIEIEVRAKMEGGAGLGAGGGGGSE